jgi:Flp pilus assembly protein TadG
MRIRGGLSAPTAFALKTKVKNEHGAELAEFALVVPLLFTFLLGIFWFARAYNIYETITRAAREGVRFAVAPNCATCGNKLPTDAEIQNVINGSLRASALDPARTNPNPITVARTPIGGGGGTPPDIDVSVSFSYPFQFYLPFTSLNMRNMNISTTVHMRQEQ